MSDASAPEPIDYRDTVFLPKTDFPMKAGLPQKEPGIQARWAAMGLYERLRDQRRGREKFIFHDGPPYANGDMHIGHALNHILKDMVVRTQSLLGKDAPYVPGWDCHGLPIEWKVEEEYRKKKLNKDEVPVKEFRAECRAYAQHWVNTQREQLKRLGINADWDNPYLTMDYAAEATIVSELMKFAEMGQLYRGAKPVMWSPVEKTALAEAEVEYEDITSTQIDVAFEITESPIAELVGAYAVIWTTTPWTIPVNQALAYGPDVEYVLIDPQINGSNKTFFHDDVPEMRSDITDHPSFSWFDGCQLLVAKDLLPQLTARMDAALKDAGLSDGDSLCKFDYAIAVDAQLNKIIVKGSELAGTIARHPMHHLGGFFAKPRPFLPGDFVTIDAGTGLVHMSPDHGEDDFLLCKANGIDPVFAVTADGKYREDWAWLGGQGSVINPKFNAPDGPICEALREAGGLLAASFDFKHSYPHSWRSKAKVIYRCTPQWFVPMDKPIVRDKTLPVVTTDDAIGHARGIPATLRETAMQAIADTRFVPEKGRNRLGSMVEGRPDWVLSRQRAWGVPITLFVHRQTGEYLVDAGVNDRIVAAIREGGVDAWCEERAQEYLGSGYNLVDYERVVDILDVWFDSGCTHAFVLESGRWPDLQSPADLYLEGSDQHRGWFQSSLLQSCGTRGRAPYKAVLTHGFTMDQTGRKMSKSLGNTTDPLKLMTEFGADILRLWALTVDFTEDHRIGKEILAGVSDQYRKLRNSFRYLLGALEGFSEAEKLPVSDMPELERYVLHLLAEMDAKLRQAVADYDFNTYVRLISDFANNDLSAFFFDIRKDCLYCDAPDSVKRRAYRTVLDTLFQALIRYAAPVIVFTAEEIWQTRYPDPDHSVHFSDWPEVDAGWVNSELNDKWTVIRALRADVTAVLEQDRREKRIGSSLEAEVDLVVDWSEDRHGIAAVNLAEIAIVSGLSFSLGKSETGQNVSVKSRVTTNHKCGRCWQHLPEVSQDGHLCGRCQEVVNG